MRELPEEIRKLLVANRGEIAVRIVQAAKERGLETVAVHPQDDAAALHVSLANRAVQLPGTGAAAYLNIGQVIAAALGAGCDALHPGYGFLAENAELARRCEEAGLIFVGPRADVLELLGDKVRARALAGEAGVATLPASGVLEEEAAARRFFDTLEGGAVIVKAVAGGGGRGMRVVRSAAELAPALERAASEAAAAFGSDALYLEAYLAEARHIEVQVAGDAGGAVVQFGERDCSIQRRHQKLVEIAPAPNLPQALCEEIQAAAVRIARAAGLTGVGTFEFLVEGRSPAPGAPFYFMEANPRIQVEHTVTEEVMGVDLVGLQLELAAGRSLRELGMAQEDIGRPRGFAIQLRVNTEVPQPDGSVLPAAGPLDLFEPPRGAGVRVDTHGYAGYQTSPHYDPLLAKLIVSGPSFEGAIARARRALSEFVIAGVDTNLGFLSSILAHPDFASGELSTGFVGDNLEALTSGAADMPLAEKLRQRRGSGGEKRSRGGAAAQPLEVGVQPVAAPMAATVIALSAAPGDLVRQGEELLVLTALKMEHVVEAPVSGRVDAVFADMDGTVAAGDMLLTIREEEVAGEGEGSEAEIDLYEIRPDLAEVLRRRDLTSDEARAAATEKRRRQNSRTARENVADLCDAGSFIQYGTLAIGSGLRGTVDELLDYAPSDGLVMGLGRVNGDLFGPEMSRCVAIAYDYTVLAGTQGAMSHKLLDRMLTKADRLDSPVVIFTEGGGGRAGGGGRHAKPDSGGAPNVLSGGILHTPSWAMLAKLSGRVPLIGINSGYCFAGNAALLGCCDAIIATENSSIGMGGPAMIEGGGLGVYAPEEVGPMSVQVPNGVVDIAVADEEEAVAAAKRYLSYFQGPVAEWTSADQRLLRHAIPENRLRVYDIRPIIETLMDAGSVLELRRGFGRAMITAFARLEGRPVGIVANDPKILSGAIDSDAADKAARFLKLCDAFGIPIVYLCDTPGIMVGPEEEKTALVRHASRLFVVGASVTVPTYMVILRKSYGLGAQAMGGGHQGLPAFTIAWPTGEFGGMGLEGQVRLGQRARLEAIEDPEEREHAFQKMVAAAYEYGKGLSAAHGFEIDELIDPAETRRWLSAGLNAAPLQPSFPAKKRPCIDSW